LQGATLLGKCELASLVFARIDFSHLAPDTRELREIDVVGTGANPLQLFREQSVDPKPRHD
jgi:hypothetical protein